MAALNNSMTTSDGKRPIEFPEEKIIQIHDDVQLRLSISSAGKVFDARGYLYLTNKRVVFLSPHHEQMASLSILLEYVVDGVLAQPIFGNNRWECTVLRQNVNNEEDEKNILKNGGDIKVWFSNGGTFDFYQGVEEARERLGNYNNAPQYEPLPLYERNTSNNNNDDQNNQNNDIEPNDDEIDTVLTVQDINARDESLRQGENPPPYE